jgi:serine O-acetyltransferase
MILYKLWENLNLLRSVPAILFFHISREKCVIKKDINRWVEFCNLSDLNYGINKNLSYLLLYYPEFRNLFYYRLKKSSNIAFVLSVLIRVFYHPMQTLYLSTSDIGAGLFIRHGFSTIIAAKSIGENCWIYQQVTIGYSNATDHPTILDNVTICAGAKVIGNVTIGNNSIVGANAVVVKDVPDNCTVVGAPAYIVKRDGIKVKEQL